MSVLKTQGLFPNDACRGLDALELVDRGRHIADGLSTHLPPSYPDAIGILLRSLGPEHATDELIGVGMAPFFYLPHTLSSVDGRGLDHFALSLQAQYELTKRLRAEGSIRPYIARDPEQALAFLRAWAADKTPHVRRLVSEGTRLRLPWAVRVAWLDQNPERVAALLELLKDDESTMVRRSVANTLNDLGKVRPDLLIRTAGAWAVHFVQARGVGAPTVFTLGRIVLEPRERVDLTTTFSLAVHTTRVPRPGRHIVDVIVNGRAIRAGSFDVSRSKA